MLLGEVGGREMLYSGDFRRTGRKSVLADRMLEQPPSGVDVLLMEGTTLCRSGGYPTESELELKFVECFNRTAGRVFVAWSSQNIDRTVTIFRACKRAGRTLVLDPYALDVLDRLAAFSNNLPRLGWEGLRAVVTTSISRLYENPDRLGKPEVVDRIARSGQAFGAARLEEGDRRTVIMLRPPLLRDFLRTGVVLTGADAWVFSMWSGYLDRPGYDVVPDSFAAVGVDPELIHTSGHASTEDLLAFARAVSPKTLVPVHGEVWDDHVKDFPAVRRLADDEVLGF